jgi:hypothetical protein
MNFYLFCSIMCDLLRAENLKFSLNVHFVVPKSLPPGAAAPLVPPPAKPLNKMTLLLGHKYRCSNSMFYVTDSEPKLTWDTVSYTNTDLSKICRL